MQLQQAVLAYIRQHRLLKAGDRVGAAVSGGADSVALLRLLLDLREEIGIVLSVIHFNHKLRALDSDDDERFVAALAEQHNLQFHCASGNVADHAATHRLSVETAARELRYRYFRQLLLEGGLNRVATAHTFDDQAETVLLRLVRGAGSRGLAGIYPQLSVMGSQSSDARAPAIVRPLLATQRKNLEAYLEGISQAWREDKSNRDPRHARNRVRHEILPCLERHLNPGVRGVLAETAEIARAEEAYWDQQTKELLKQAWKTAPGMHSGNLRIEAIEGLPLAAKRRVLRAAAESLGLRLEFRHVEEVLGVAAGQSKSAMLPDGWTASLHRRELRFAVEDAAPNPSGYEVCLALSGAVDVPQIGSRFEAVVIPRNSCEVYNREHLLDRSRLEHELRVRNWRAGDRFWPAHTKMPRKIKELLQALHVTGPDRTLWPVVASGTDLVWVRGFPVPSHFQAGKDAAEAVLIRETAMWTDD
ncbi:MAG TPA: tRNA lysidine(34) synthetase TilS [Terriglobales bacterium]|nr:tRNA lysidine(34) synthetase TilS [Terriglobales bacterium]